LNIYHTTNSEVRDLDNTVRSYISVTEPGCLQPLRYRLYRRPVLVILPVYRIMLRALMIS